MLLEFLLFVPEELLLVVVVLLVTVLFEGVLRLTLVLLLRVWATVRFGLL